jgi:hypothetical protein
MSSIGKALRSHSYPCLLCEHVSQNLLEDTSHLATQHPNWILEFFLKHHREPYAVPTVDPVRPA